MSKKDEIKENIALLRNVFLIALTAWLGMIAFLFANSENLNDIKITLNVLAIALMSVVLVVLYFKYCQKVKQLKDL